MRLYSGCARLEQTGAFASMLMVDVLRYRMLINTRVREVTTRVLSRKGVSSNASLCCARTLLDRATHISLGVQARISKAKYTE